MLKIDAETAPSNGTILDKFSKHHYIAPQHKKNTF